MRNRLHGGTRPPTIRDIAAEAGVSVATISRVLNEHENVAPETREAVLRIVRERGFSTNRSARALSGGRTGLVGVMLPMIQSSYFSTLTASVTEALHEHDLRAVICPTLHEHDREVSLLERLMRGTTEGAVLILPSESNAELSALAESGYPFVVLDPKLPLEADVPSVSAANTAGGIAATRHLLELGHTRIAAITGPPGWCATTERLDGYRAALAEATVEIDPTLVLAGNFEIAGGRDAASQLLHRRRRPTAIFAFNDNLAIGALHAAREHGVRVPEELSIVGFDDGELAAAVTPALTTVRQPLPEMGRVAVDRLTRLLEGRSVEALRVELATRLVVRASTAKA